MAFLVVQLPPGDFATFYVQSLLGAGQGAGASGNILGDPALEAQLRADFGLDRPVPIQYLKWLQRIVTGDWGMSFAFGRPIAEVIGDRLANTLILAVGTILFTWILAIPIGIYSAVHHNTPQDYAVTFLRLSGAGGAQLPARADIAVVGGARVRLGDRRPVLAGIPQPAVDVGQVHEHAAPPDRPPRSCWAPPARRRSSASCANNLLDELGKQYVMSARAKGVAEWKLIFKYPVRLAFNPFISTMGYLLPFLLSGDVIVSTVLSLPTVGPVLLQAILSEDLYLASTIFLWLGMLTVIGTLISDLLLAITDPRIRLSLTRCPRNQTKPWSLGRTRPRPPALR